MQCKRCKTFFKYDKYDGICPQCAYFNRPPGMEEVDLFEDDTVIKSRIKRKKRQKIMPDTFQIIWKEKQRKIWKQKKMLQTAEYVSLFA